MGVVRRWFSGTARGGTARGGTADPVWRFLTAEDADQLRRLLTEAYRALGYHPEWDGPFARLGGGTLVDLTSVAMEARQCPPSRWPTLASEHASWMQQHRRLPDPGAGQPAVFPVLRMVDEVVPPPPFTPEEPIPGMILLYHRGVPGPVSTYLRDLGALSSPAELKDAALANLARWLYESNRRTPTKVDTTEATPGDPTSVNITIKAGSHLGATSALLLTGWLKSLGVEDPPDGVVFSVPSMYELTAHPMTGPGVLTAVPDLLAKTVETHRREATRMSPHLYYRTPDGHVSQITWVDQAGEVSVRWDEGDFGEAVSRLTES